MGVVSKSKESLKKREKEDGDYVFFDIETGEIVFVSAESGYIRTYYIADYDYFHRQ